MAASVTPGRALRYARGSARGLLHHHLGHSPFRPDAVVRFDDTVYRNVPTHPIGSVRFTRHLLGPDRAPLIDGNPGGEEFRCAWALDSLEEVEVWARNVARHEDSFWLPRVNGRFFPDFVARLRDGRVFVVEYKGAMLAGGADAR